ncbi:hypothetical protein [Candidatus Accumulibacter sp. ACC012]|uniref:hypothetical protein n=1 Tax=Candidatus Accumulibacter sp. ACC012 TaxID=2823332 RepID=UPI0025C11EB0|nr:hypothetical protein [Candidatus Accumulibacter sp. ACC012]
MNELDEATYEYSDRVQTAVSASLTLNKAQRHNASTSNTKKKMISAITAACVQLEA